MQSSGTNNVFGDVSVEQIPMYVLNKSVSFAGLILLGWSRCEGDPARRRELGTLALALVVVHVVLSLTLLNPAYFAKFFHTSGLMTWQAEASMLAGALAFLAICWLFLASQGRRERSATSRRASLVPGLGRVMLALTAGHVALMGYAGWLTPSRWHGYLPPITLLSFAAALILFFCRRRDD